MLYLPDPRKYLPVNPKNPYIRQVMALLTAREAEGQAQAQTELSRLLHESLIANQDNEIQEALRSAPSQEAYQQLWTTLSGLIEDTPFNDSDNRVTLFALPIVLVVGAKHATQVPGKLNHISSIVEILKKHHIFTSDKVWLSNRLYALASLQGLKFSQLYRWSTQLVDTARGLPIELPEAPILAKTESVHLRYLIGLSMQPAHQPPAVKMGGNAASWGMTMTQALSSQLAQEGLTLFPIPRAPLPLLQAMYQGHFAKMEIGLQLYASNIIRKVRQTSGEPIAVISSHDNNEIRLSISSSSQPDLWAGYVWPLHPLDSVELIVNNTVSLLTECQVQDIRIQPEVLPDKHDNLPLFLTAFDTKPVAGSGFTASNELM